MSVAEQGDKRMVFILAAALYHYLVQQFDDDILGGPASMR